MRISPTSIAVVSFLLLGALPAAAQTRSPAAPVPLTTDNGSTADRDTYTQKATDQMQEWQQKLRDFGEKAKAQGKTAGDATAGALDDAWTKTQTEGHKLQAASADGWESAKRSYEQASRKLVDAWNKIRPEDR